MARWDLVNCGGKLWLYQWDIECIKNNFPEHCKKKMKKNIKYLLITVPGEHLVPVFGPFAPQGAGPVD